MVKGGDKEKMKKQIITLTAIVAILAAAIFAGCVEKETPVSTQTTSPVVTPTQTPLHEAKYIRGDIVQKKHNWTYPDIAHFILKYQSDIDSYKSTSIFSVDGIWTYRSEDESWLSREFIELDGIKVGHVDVSKVMSREEYMDGGGYEKEHATPTSTPEILSENTYIDNRGYAKVVGEVKNNLQSNINYVKLTATFYDAGGKVVGTDFTYAELDILKPNQKSPFEISSYPDKIVPDKYKVHLSYDTTGQSPYTGLVILSHSDKIDNLGYHKIIGEVKNNGVRASSYVKVVSTYYNAKGEVIGTEFTFTDPSEIAAGDSAPFEISSYPRKLRPSRYELQVEGN